MCVNFPCHWTFIHFSINAKDAKCFKCTTEFNTLSISYQLTCYACNTCAYIVILKCIRSLLSVAWDDVYELNTLWVTLTYTTLYSSRKQPLLQVDGFTCLSNNSCLEEAIICVVGHMYENSSFAKKSRLLQDLLRFLCILPERVNNVTESEENMSRVASHRMSPTTVSYYVIFAIYSTVPV